MYSVTQKLKSHCEFSWFPYLRYYNHSEFTRWCQVNYSTRVCVCVFFRMLELFFKGIRINKGRLTPTLQDQCSFQVSGIKHHIVDCVPVCLQAGLLT